MSITSDIIRGHTDAIILSQLEQGDSYGYKIIRNISEQTEKALELKEATLYTAFKRLEELGCISAYWGDEISGARRRYYRITPLGRDTCTQLRKEWRSAKQLIDLLITEEEV